MLAKKCDRCGKLYESAVKEINGKDIDSIAIANREKQEYLINENFYDLCEDCLISFKNWIEIKHDDEEDQDPYGIPPYKECEE